MGRAARWVVAGLVTAAAFAVATWVSGAFLFPRLLPSPDARWPVAFCVGASAAAFAGLWGQTWATGLGNADRAASLSLAGIATELAGRLRSQWEREAEARGLNDPYPLPVSWNAADVPLAGDLVALRRLAVSSAAWSGPAREDWARGLEDLAGEGGELVDVLARVPTGRLVVLGEPGAGKTMLVVRLVLDLLARRADGAPVPVLASVASWNPAEQDLHGWLAATLITGYPDLALPAPPGSAGGNRFEALLAAGLILPVLDGLDEIPESARPAAIARINRELRPGEQVVVTCRTEQYRAAVSPQDGQGAALRAAAVQLSALEFDEVASYLRKDAGPASEGRWDFLDTLGAGSPVRQALAMPLMAGLARAIYNPRPGEMAGDLRDPGKELRKPDLADRKAVESLLFDAFIPAAYRVPTGGRWAKHAEMWLAFLASHLEQTGSPDLAWWQLKKARTGAWAGTKAPARGVIVSIRGLVFALVVALAAGVVAGVVAGIGAGVGLGLAVGLMGVLVLGLVGVPGDLATAASPRAVLARDRQVALLFRLVPAVVVGVVAGFAVGVAVGLAVGLAAGLAVGLGLLGVLFPGLCDKFQAAAPSRALVA